MREIITQSDVYVPMTPKGHKLATMRSMLQKAIRRGKINDAVYAAHEMFYNYNEYMWKTLLTVSAEDCFGLITQEIWSLYQVQKFIQSNNKNKEIPTIYVSKAICLLVYDKHNRDADLVACNLFNDNIYEIVDIKDVDESERIDDLPDYIFDCHTKEGRIAGKKKEDFFKEEEESMSNKQISLFEFVKNQ